MTHSLNGVLCNYREKLEWFLGYAVKWQKAKCKAYLQHVALHIRKKEIKENIQVFAYMCKRNIERKNWKPTESVTERGWVGTDRRMWEWERGSRDGGDCCSSECVFFKYIALTLKYIKHIPKIDLKS